MALARQIPDSMTRHLWKEYLTHTVTVTPIGGMDDHGQRTLGTPLTKVPCNIGPTKRRMLDAQQNPILAQWEVLFAGTADIGADYLLSNGLDRDGGVLLPSAKVINVQPADDPRMGNLVFSAFCIPQ
jgi:hypothetical protein